MIATWYKALQESIVPIADSFSVVYSDELGILEDGLLIDLGPKFALQHVKFPDPSGVVSELSSTVDSYGGLAIKTIDSGVEFIPWIGGGYGFAKIAYDPRLEYIKKTVSVACDKYEEECLRQYLATISIDSTSVETMRNRCRASFTPSNAVSRSQTLNRETRNNDNDN